MQTGSKSIRTDGDLSRRKLVRLKWLAVLVPAIGVFTYESVRHSFLEDHLPAEYGNVLVGLIGLVLAYVFAQALFASVERVHRGAVSQREELAALKATTQERERLSRDLHDGLAQVLSYILVRLDLVDSLTRNGRSAEAAAEIALLRRTTESLYSDVRESISGLRSRLDQRDLVPALRDYLDEFEERHGIVTALSTERESLDIRPTDAMEVFRIVQEALANVRKHAFAEHVSVSLETPRPGQLALTVADDGRGFDAEAISSSGQSYGLVGMQERAEALGGELEVESCPGVGTRISLKIPTSSRPKAERETVAAATG